ncbi:MAG: M48 family metalloprotease [Pseudomonadota bacterium]
MIRIFLLLAALFLAACDAGTPTLQTLPAPVRPTAPAVSVSQPVAAFRQVVDRMEPVIERECRRRTRGMDCDFVLLLNTNPRLPPNAFQTLGDNGKPVLGFTIALLEDMRNTDEMAFVVGHEAAHHISNHLERQRQNATLGATTLGVLAQMSGATAQGVREAAEFGAALGARSYSKDFELEADQLGTILTLIAGYNPVRGAEYFNRIPDPGNRFLGTHPPNAQRIAIVRRTAAGL